MQNGTSIKTGAEARTARFVTVDIPPSHQGVGQALRAAYGRDLHSLPADMMALLDQLDQR